MFHNKIPNNQVALCETQHAGKEIVTRPMSEYFGNDPECHNLLQCTLQSHRVAGLRGCPTGPPVESRPRRLRPCAVLWPCTFCSDRRYRPLVKFGYADVQTCKMRANIGTVILLYDTERELLVIAVQEIYSCTAVTRMGAEQAPILVRTVQQKYNCVMSPDRLLYMCTCRRPP